MRESRTFRRKITIGMWSGLILFALLTLYLLWQKQAIGGVVAAVLFVLLMEQALHSTYVFKGGELIVNRGRFLKCRQIAVSQISRCTRQRSWMGLGSYLLMEYGDGKLIALEPKEEQSFLAELRKRQNSNDED